MSRKSWIWERLVIYKKKGEEGQGMAFFLGNVVCKTTRTEKMFQTELESTKGGTRIAQLRNY